MQSGYKIIAESFCAGKKEGVCLYDAVFDTMEDAVFVLDNNIPPSIVDSNKAVKNIFGYSGEELKGKTTGFMFQSQENLSQYLKVLIPALENEGSHSVFELSNLHRNGEVFPAEHSVLPITDSDGSRVGWILVIRDISKRKAAEEKLRRTEEQLRAFMDASPESFLLFDQNLELVEINPVGLSRFPKGSTRQEIIGKSILDLSPNSMDRYDTYMDVLKTGKPFVLEEFVPHPKFGKSVMKLKAFKVGNGLGIIASDITKEKEAETALRESEEDLRSTLASLDDLVYVLDVNGIFTNFYQPGRQSSLLMPSEEFLGKPYRDMLPLHVAKMTGEAISNAVATKKVQQFEYSIKFGEQEFWFNASVSLRKDRSGEYAGVTIVARNITERKRIDQELRIQQNRLAMAINASKAGIYDHAEPIESAESYHSERWAEILGYTVDELPPSTDFMAWLTPKVHPYDLPRLEKVYSEFITKSDAKYDIEIKMRHKSGKWIWVRGLSTATQRDEEGNAEHIVGVMLDISEQKTMEELLRQQKDEIGLYLDIITHDLKNFHHSALGFLDFALKEPSPTYIKTALKNVVRANNLLESISILMRQKVEREYDLAPVNVLEEIEQVKKTVNDIFPDKQVKIKTNSKESEFYVLADSLIRQLFLNLLTNAVKNDDHEVIQIGMNLEVDPSDGTRIISVIDHGNGIPVERRKDIFERFSEFKRKGKGSGLGMFIVKTLVDRYRGKVTIENRIPEDYTQGTVFAIRLQSP